MAKFLSDLREEYEKERQRKEEGRAATRNRADNEEEDEKSPDVTTTDPSDAPYDSTLDSMGFVRRRLLQVVDHADQVSLADHQHLEQVGRESLHYGDVTDNCQYAPKQDCKQVEKCTEEPHTDCRTAYRPKCRQVPRQVCETRYEQDCYRVPQEDCATEYDTKCEEVRRFNISILLSGASKATVDSKKLKPSIFQVPYDKCDTTYEKSCRTEYKEIKRYKTENHCYWPQSHLRDEPCQ